MSIAGKPESSRNEGELVNWSAADQSLLAATLAATPAQRLAWLEEAIRVAYASGALKPKKLIGIEEWEAMGSSSRE